jgi:hypothetical protein
VKSEILTSSKKRNTEDFMDTGTAILQTQFEAFLDEENLLLHDESKFSKSLLYFVWKKRIEKYHEDQYGIKKALLQTLEDMGGEIIKELQNLPQ